MLTYTRIITTPFIGYYITTGQSTAALLLFTYSCVTDFVDGYIARKYNMKSIVGSIVDPLADKLLMTVCTVSLGYVHAIPPVIASIIIGRDVMLRALCRSTIGTRACRRPRRLISLLALARFRL